MTAAEVCRISEQTFYSWKRCYGEMSTSEVKRLRELEVENARLKRLLDERLRVGIEAGPSIGAPTVRVETVGDH